MFNDMERIQVESIEAKQVPQPIDRETRTHLPTDEAAYHLNRQVQTLRIWACKENGPLRPVRIGGRLAWPVAEIKRVLGVA